MGRHHLTAQLVVPLGYSNYGCGTSFPRSRISIRMNVRTISFMKWILGKPLDAVMDFNGHVRDFCMHGKPFPDTIRGECGIVGH